MGGMPRCCSRKLRRHCCVPISFTVGEVEPLTTTDVVGRSVEAMKGYQGGVLADYAPYTPYTDTLFQKLAALKPQRLAIMHGSSFEGDGARALTDLAVGFKEVFGGNGRPTDE